MDKMTSGEGQLYDPGSDTWYYYYSFTNPDWFVKQCARVGVKDHFAITLHHKKLALYGGHHLAQREPHDDYHFQTHHHPGRETQGQPGLSSRSHLHGVRAAPAFYPSAHY
jgi:hypothetical protein